MVESLVGKGGAQPNPGGSRPMIFIGWSEFFIRGLATSKSIPLTINWLVDCHLPLVTYRLGRLGGAMMAMIQTLEPPSRTTVIL